MISHDPMYPVPPVTHTAPLCPSISLSLSREKSRKILGGLTVQDNFAFVI